MELVTNTTREHPDHGTVTVEDIYRRYSSYDTADGTGHIPGAWFVRYTVRDGGETRIDPVKQFIKSISSQ